MKAVLFSLGPLHFYRYGFFVALGVVAGLWLARTAARRRGMDPEALTDVALAAAFAGLLGARLEHVLFDLPYYLARPGEILQLSEGGLSVHGALVAGTVVVIWLCRKKRLPFLVVADVFAPAVALGEAIGRIGCDVVGRATTWPLAIVRDGVRYHNVPLYSSAFLAALFAYLWFYRRPRSRMAAEVFLEFVLWYSAGRFLIEFARTSPPAAFGLSLAQLVSLVLVGTSIVALAAVRRRTLK